MVNNYKHAYSIIEIACTRYLFYMKFLLCKNLFMILPNFIEAENPFPAPFPLAKNSINTWLPRELTSDEVKVPVIEISWLSLELPPSYMFKKFTLSSSYKGKSSWNWYISIKIQDILTYLKYLKIDRHSASYWSCNNPGAVPVWIFRWCQNEWSWV